MKKILLVDDSKASKMLFNAHLPDKASYEVHEAVDRNTAMEVGGNVRPDIVFMDYNLPGDNGVEIAKAMLSSGILAKYVLLTANTQESVVDAAMAAGFVTVMEKPITQEKIAGALQKVA